MTWEDDRFKWDYKEYGNLTEITLPVNRLWVRFFYYKVLFLINYIFYKNEGARYSLTGYNCSNL